MLSLKLKDVKMKKQDRLFFVCLDVGLCLLLAAAAYMIGSSAITLLQGFDGAVAIHLGMGILMIALCMGMLHMITNSVISELDRPAKISL